MGAFQDRSLSDFPEGRPAVKYIRVRRIEKAILPAGKEDTVILKGSNLGMLE